MQRDHFQIENCFDLLTPLRGQGCVYFVGRDLGPNCLQRLSAGRVDCFKLGEKNSSVKIWEIGRSIDKQKALRLDCIYNDIETTDLEIGVSGIYLHLL